MELLLLLSASHGNSMFAGGIRAAGMCLALADRNSNEMLDYSKLEQLEIKGGRVALEALSRTKLEGCGTQEERGRALQANRSAPAYTSVDLTDVAQVIMLSDEE